MLKTILGSNFCIPIYLLVIAGLDPAIHPSKHNAIHRPRHSNAVSVAQCCQLAARLPCRSSPGCVFYYVIPGLDPGIHPSKYNAIHRLRHSNAASVVQCCQLAARLPCRSSPAMTQEKKAREWQCLYILLLPPKAQSLIRHDWVPFANSLGFGAKTEIEAQW